MHHMIGSSVAHDGEQGNMWQWTKKMRSRATEIEMHRNVKQRSTEVKHEPRHEARTNQKQEAKCMCRPWQSEEVGCQLSPLHDGTAYHHSIQLPYGVPNTKHEVQVKKPEKRDRDTKKLREKQEKRNMHS